MPTSSADGIRDERHMQASHVGCGLFFAGPESMVPECVAEHFAADHDGETWSAGDPRGNVLVEVAPWRCDACNTPVEPPWWKHRCDPPLDSSNPMGTTDVIDADGIWLLCDGCHEDARAAAIGGMVHRAEEVSRRNYPRVWVERVNAVKMRRHYARQFSALSERLDAGTRVTSWPVS